MRTGAVLLLTLLATACATTTTQRGTEQATDTPRSARPVEAGAAQFRDIDVATALSDKMVKNAKKYPAQEYRGRYGPEDV